MPSALVIPGVQIRTLFEPAPVLSGATGILGVVGVTDRGPIDPTPVGSFSEFLTTFGEGSRYTMPEVRQAITNGVSRVVVARTAPGGAAKKAAAVLKDDEGDDVVRIEARAEGAWGNQVAVRVTQTRTLEGRGVRYVNLDVLQSGEVREWLPNLVMDPASPNYLFDVINDRSTLVVATDPLFDKSLPSPITRTALAPAPEDRPASAALASAGDAVVQASARKPGPDGNRIAIRVEEGRAALALPGPNNAPSVQVLARKPGPPSGVQVSVTADADKRTLTITPEAPATPRSTTFTKLDELVAAVARDPDVEVQALGDALPDAHDAARLRRRIDLTVLPEGRDSKTYPAIGSLAALAAIKDPLVAFAAVDGATKLPDATDGAFLSGGTTAGQRVLDLIGEGAPEPLLQLIALTDPTISVAVELAAATSAAGDPVVALSVFEDDVAAESYADLTMDPDDDGYLPEVLAASKILQARDLFVARHTTSMPAGTPRPIALSGGTSPNADAFQEALDRLESAEEVDLVIASVDNQLDQAGVRTVHQEVVAHCTKMADVARNRIGIGSVTADEATSVPAILDHADDVRSDHFVLTTPAGSAGALAGLLGLQDYFESPTFKTVPALGVPAGQYTDSELTSLVTGNAVVINERRGLGVIVIKGLLTSGRQINVQRTANKTVRDVKAIAQKYIGLLNNDGARNALRQQIFAMLLQMERDGAIVPSTDGSSPAFSVDVHSTQADFANGIVRIDVAVRPVRAIDYVYGTILVQN